MNRSTVHHTLLPTLGHVLCVTFRETLSDPIRHQMDELMTMLRPPAACGMGSGPDLDHLLKEPLRAPYDQVY